MNECSANENTQFEIEKFVKRDDFEAAVMNFTEVILRFIDILEKSGQNALAEKLLSIMESKISREAMIETIHEKRAMEPISLEDFMTNRLKSLGLISKTNAKDQNEDQDALSESSNEPYEINDVQFVSLNIVDASDCVGEGRVICHISISDDADDPV